MTIDPVLAGLQAQADARRALLARAATVLQAIDAEIGPRPFINAELAVLAAHPDAQRLRAAIIAAVGGTLNMRKLGRLFASIEGVNLGGFEIHRLGEERDGGIWKVVAGLSEDNPPSCLTRGKSHADFLALNVKEVRNG